MFDYFYGSQSDQFSFYRVPKVLFTDQHFKKMSADAKSLYGILLDRMNLSAKNGWTDKEGRVYIIFTVEEVMAAMGCANQKATRLLAELENDIGLIERKRRGMGKPNLIYVKNFISCEKGHGQKSHSKNHENHESGNVKITVQESWKSHGNNTNSNNTDLNNIDSNNTDLISAVVESKEKRSTRISYEEYFKKNLEIDLLKKIYPWQVLLLNGIFNLIVDTCSSDYRWIMIGGRKRPQVVVKSRFMKLNRTHIEYVLQCLSKNTEEIRDMRHYLLVTLYNISTDTKPMIRSKTTTLN
jgi:hypothetical protein